jgi:hypothetical protein
LEHSGRFSKHFWSHWFQYEEWITCVWLGACLATCVCFKVNEKKSAKIGQMFGAVGPDWANLSFFHQQLVHVLNGASKNTLDKLQRQSHNFKHFASIILA